MTSKAERVKARMAAEAADKAAKLAAHVKLWDEAHSLYDARHVSVVSEEVQALVASIPPELGIIPHLGYRPVDTLKATRWEPGLPNLRLTLEVEVPDEEWGGYRRLPGTTVYLEILEGSPLFNREMMTSFSQYGVSSVSYRRTVPCSYETIWTAATVRIGIPAPTLYVGGFDSPEHKERVAAHALVWETKARVIALTVAWENGKRDNPSPDDPDRLFWILGVGPRPSDGGDYNSYCSGFITDPDD